MEPACPVPPVAVAAVPVVLAEAVGLAPSTFTLRLARLPVRQLRSALLLRQRPRPRPLLWLRRQQQRLRPGLLPRARRFRRCRRCRHYARRHFSMDPRGAARAASMLLAQPCGASRARPCTRSSCPPWSRRRAATRPRACARPRSPACRWRLRGLHCLRLRLWPRRSQRPSSKAAAMPARAWRVQRTRRSSCCAERSARRPRWPQQLVGRPRPRTVGLSRQPPLHPPRRRLLPPARNRRPCLRERADGLAPHSAAPSALGRRLPRPCLGHFGVLRRRLLYCPTRPCSCRSSWTRRLAPTLPKATRGQTTSPRHSRSRSHGKPLAVRQCARPYPAPCRHPSWRISCSCQPQPALASAPALLPTPRQALRL